MFKDLIIEDCKSHENTKLEFSKRINVITGDSGQGKTNILQALKLVKDNRPLGTGYIRRGQKGCKVSLSVTESDGEYGISRNRGKISGEDVNNYVLTKDGKKFATIAAGTTPPDEVTKILNLSDINIQKQRDPYFLVYAPPGQIATYIRAITKLDEIDEVRQLLSSDIRSEKADVVRDQGELETNRTKLKTLIKIDLDGLEKRITKAKEVIRRIDETRSTLSKLKNIVDAIRDLDAHQIVIPENIDGTLEQANQHVESITKTSEKLERLRNLVSELKVAEATKIHLPDDLSILPKSKEVIERYNDTTKKVETLMELSEDIRDINDGIENLGKLISEEMEEKKKLESQLTSCPHCGSKLTENTKKTLLGEGV